MNEREMNEREARQHYIDHMMGPLGTEKILYDFTPSESKYVLQQAKENGADVSAVKRSIHLANLSFVYTLEDDLNSLDIIIKTAEELGYKAEWLLLWPQHLERWKAKHTVKE